MLLSETRDKISWDSQARTKTTSVDPEVVLLVVVEIANAVKENLASHVEAEEEVEEAEETKERLRLMMSHSQLSEQIPAVFAAPKKVKVKYLCQAHAFKCRAE